MYSCFLHLFYWNLMIVNLNRNMVDFFKGLLIVQVIPLVLLIVSILILMLKSKNSIKIKKQRFLQY